MNRLPAKRFRYLGALEFLVAALLLFATMAGVAPLQSVSASAACRLACCAKRAAHAARSCADGTCHASLKRTRRSTHRAAVNHTADLCGLTGKPETKTRLRSPVANRGPVPVQVTSAVGKPCPSECSGTLANSNSQRNSAAVSGSVTAASATLHQISFTSTERSLSEARYRECAPRGPPLNLF